MKALSFQQPWASLTACGVKDVENRTWAPKTIPGKFLIHTGVCRRKADWENILPFEMSMPAFNMIERGYIEDFNETPKNCIVGVAEIDFITKDNLSAWSDERCEFKYHIKNAKLFRTPITGVKGKLHFFDVPEIDEDNLPETIDIQPIRREGSTLIVPMHEDMINEFEAVEDIADLGDYIFAQYLLADNEDLYCDSDGKLLATERIIFTDGKREVAFTVAEQFVNTRTNDEGQMEVDTTFDGKQIMCECACYTFKDKVK